MTKTASYSVLLAVIFMIDSQLLLLARADDEVTNRNDPFTKVHSTTEQKGLTFNAEYTGEVFGNLSGGLKKGATYEGLLKLSLQLDLTKPVGWNGAIIYGSMLYPHGEGITDRYTGDFNRLSNIDAYDGSLES
jgi:carbohydrate-selective porin OprB